MNLDEIVKILRDRPESNVVVFPYMEEMTSDNMRPNYIHIKIENPFFDEAKCEQAIINSEETLREAPQKIRELGYKILRNVVNTWEF